MEKLYNLMPSIKPKGMKVKEPEMIEEIISDSFKMQTMFDKEFSAISSEVEELKKK